MSNGSMESGAGEQLISAMRIVGISIWLAVAGCTGVKHALAPADTPPAAPAIEPTAAPAVEQSAAQAESPVARVEPPVANAPAKPVAAPQEQSATRTSEKKETSPALDLTTLETRLKATAAIGLFTKIALKNQVDDLLNQFRAYYRGQIKTTLAELRQPYDRLLLKVLSLLQDGDPALARDIVTSREAIWGILADPAKFATL
ncbi:MAG TPA: hypothetical protein VGA88_12260 [Burkholderiales bacterium]